MQLEWAVFKAVTQCRYKAWVLAREINGKDEYLVDENILLFDLPVETISVADKLSTVAWFQNLDGSLKTHVDPA